MTPKRFRDGGRGTQVSFTVLTSQLGDVLVATTSAGLVAVRIGECDALVDQLCAELPNATLIRDDDVIAPPSVDSSIYLPRPPGQNCQMNCQR